MRGSDIHSGNLFSCMDLEDRAPRGHPLRVIRRIAGDVLTIMPGAFGMAYAPLGRPSIPPERLMRALLLQALHVIRPERQLVERLDFDLLYRWFVGLGIGERVVAPRPMPGTGSGFSTWAQRRRFWQAWSIIRICGNKLSCARHRGGLAGSRPSRERRQARRAAQAAHVFETKAGGRTADPAW